MRTAASALVGAGRTRWVAAFARRYCKVTRSVDDEADRIHRTFFSGLVTDDHCKGRSRTIDVFGFPVFEWKKGKEDSIRILNVWSYRRHNGKALLVRIVVAVPQDCDHIYLCRHNIGETYIHLALIEEAIRSNGSERPALIVRKKEYVSLYSMLIPKSVYLVYLPILRSDLDDHVERDFYYKGRRIICGSKDILGRLKADRRRSGAANFFDFMRSDMGLKSSAGMREPAVCEARQSRLHNKMKNIGLDLNRLILLTPEASTVREIEVDFWAQLSGSLSLKGFSIFVNQTRPVFVGHSVKSAPLTIEEVYILAKEAIAIIGVASGLNVLLSSAGTPMDILYTDTGGGCSASEIMDLFSIAYLTGRSPGKVREHNTETKSLDTIATEIVGRYS